MGGKHLGLLWRLSGSLNNSFLICLDLVERLDKLSPLGKINFLRHLMQESSEQIPVVNQCPECSHSMDVSHLQPFVKIVCTNCKATVRVRTQMGQYHITGVLGEGGMSQVFRAEDVNLGREVALKILHQSLSQDSALTAMFEREAKLTALILHPNVVKVYTVGKDQGYFFIAMELVDATSLEELIVNKGALPEGDVLNIAHDVTSGLKAAHQEDLIHRDIKPGNMLVTAKGTSKLVDFGLAVQQGGADESEDLWATPFYVPPEKLDGSPDTYLGDIYSLGATLFHALAGQPPFEANTSSLEELKLIKQRDVDLKSRAIGVSKGTVKLIDQMMAYQPSDRPGSYDEILGRVEEIQKREFGIRRGGRSSKSTGKKKGLMIAAGAAVLFAVAGIAAYFAGGSMGNEDIAIGTEERVISAGENSSAEKFLRGRELMANGEFQEAANSFEDLAQRSALSPLTEQWNLFFLGMSQLFLGDAESSRAAFQSIGSIELDAETSDSDAAEFLRIATVEFSNPLPVLGPGRVFGESRLAPLGLLVSGVKNWQDGQFESGVDAMKAFMESESPTGYSWSGKLKKEIPRFLSDYAVLAELPNPSRKPSNIPLGQQKVKLEEAKNSLETPGALPSLIDQRIARIAAIGKLVAEEKVRREEEARLAQAAVTTKPAPKETVPKPKKGDLTPEEQSEIAQLKSLVESFPNSEDKFDFAASRLAIESVAVQTAAGKRMQNDLIAGQVRATRFLDLFAEFLNANGYEGNIRRREGIPLDAKITAADPETFIIDLGFGPNEVSTGEFAPDWMIEAAEQNYPAPNIENFRRWDSLIYYAFFTGQMESSERLGELLGPVTEVFSDVWTRLEPLR